MGKNLSKNNLEELSSERLTYIKAKKRYKRLITFTQIALLLAFFIMWEVLARLEVIDSFIFSQPTRIYSTWLNMSQNNLLLHLYTTVSETLIGFTIGVVLGVIISIILWWSDFISKVLNPYLVVLNSLPKIALGPVIIVIVGAGTKAIIFMAVAISLIVTILEMVNGFNSTDKELLKMATTFGSTKWQKFYKIVLPYNISTLFNSLKINIGLSLVGVIAGEFLVSKAGLGYLIVYGGQVFKLDLVMSSVLILTIIAGLMYEIIVVIEKIVTKKWKR